MERVKSQGQDGAQIRKRGKCWFYGRKIGCRRGDACPFEHVTQKRVCFFFNSTKGCRRGDDCKFVHDVSLKKKCQFRRGRAPRCELQHCYGDGLHRLQQEVARLVTQVAALQSNPRPWRKQVTRTHTFLSLSISIN